MDATNAGASHSKKVPIEDVKDREIVVSRVFDAPRELVWEAWTDPEAPREMVGPGRVYESNLRGGRASRWIVSNRYALAGRRRFSLLWRVPRGGRAPSGSCSQISRLTAMGKKVLDGLTKVTFAEQGGKTKLTLETSATALVDYAAEYLKGMEAGWTQSLERLAEQLVQW